MTGRMDQVNVIVAHSLEARPLINRFELKPNKIEASLTVYSNDSGIRLNLVTDYFELYFPVYSNRGWEIAQDNYGERIRFIVTISPRTLTGLFTRKWF